MNGEVLALSSDGTLRRRMTMLLEASGYVVRSVSCAKEALAQLEKLDGVIVSDMLLSDTDAPSFLRSVRAVAEELPVIFVIQVGNTMAALEVVRAGAYQLVERDGLRARLVRTVSGAFEALAEARVAREPTASGRVKPLYRARPVSRRPLLSTCGLHGLHAPPCGSGLATSHSSHVTS
ncbi:MAG: DNA-binding NtrC family response regulator [Myxococcota bacterium]|jgi:DNA-binding NtrC family response regulator